EQLVQAHFGREQLRAEAHLRHAALDRHLAAFEADLVVAALARALPLHATAAGLALAGGGTATHAPMHLAGAGGGFHVIETHGHTITPEPSAGAWPHRSFRGSAECRQPAPSGGDGAGRGHAPTPGCSSTGQP